MNRINRKNLKLRRIHDFTPSDRLVWMWGWGPSSQQVTDHTLNQKTVPEKIREETLKGTNTTLQKEERIRKKKYSQDKGSKDSQEDREAEN